MGINKYGNEKINVDGLTFDSKAESRRYKELKLLESAGEIKSLQLQPKFELVEKTKGERDVTYIAYFMYLEKPKEPLAVWQVVAEDVKDVKTKDYIIKRKLLKARYTHIDFRELEV